MDIEQWIWLALFAPLVSFLTILATSSVISRRLVHLLACSSVFISFCCFLFFLYHSGGGGNPPLRATLFDWIATDAVHASFTVYIDALAIVMGLNITGVGFLIHVYSMGYMEHDEDYARYFGCMNFFIFSMLLLVLAANLPLLFVGWEGVGLASYLLIGYYYNREAAAAAATKAFVVNRIGDVGLLVGILLTFFLFQTADISEVLSKASTQMAVGAPALMLLTLLYFIGAVGKSAQIPLHVWLPDAMEGPTPVSALIHAATMVTAGVYLVVRMHPLYLMAPSTMHFVGAVGGTTALFAALCAVGQNDLKRVLAYSTVSQLGLMFLACGVAAFYAAIFHLVTHAFMKGLLFLAAGNVVHMMHGTTNMEKMGGLHQKFYLTHILFFVGVIAMSGIPPLAAFFSKDLILEEEFLAGAETLFAVGLIASILTAFYLTRAYCLTFWGESHIESKIAKVIREAPRVMLIPVCLLAVLATVGGFLGFSLDGPPPLERFLAHADITFNSKELGTGFHWTLETWLSTLGALVGIGSAAYVYLQIHEHEKQPEILTEAFYFDPFYESAFIAPLRALSKWIVGFWEPTVIDGSIYLAAHSASGGASWLQRMQSGQIRSYAAWLTIGLCLTLFYFMT